jgi:hypothetical protein
MNIVSIKGSIKTTRSLENGFKSLGDDYSIIEDLNDSRVQNADCFLQTNLIKPKIANSPSRREAYQYILKSNKPFLVLESPVFRRYYSLKYVRLGWYSYKWNDGIFGNTNSPNDRWERFQKESGIVLKDWHSPGDSIVIMGQKEGDSSLQTLYANYNSYYDWVEDLIIEIRKYSDRPIILRPHPRNYSAGKKLSLRLSKKYKNISVSENVKIKNQVSDQYDGDGLETDFKKAYCVITYNSLSGVESVCDGIPTFALEGGSMISPIAHTDLSQLENLKYDIDRTQWCYDVAYTQWTSKENRRGESWAHLKPLMFKE